VLNTKGAGTGIDLVRAETTRMAGIAKDPKSNWGTQSAEENIWT